MLSLLEKPGSVRCDACCAAGGSVLMRNAWGLAAFAGQVCFGSCCDACCVAGLCQVAGASVVLGLGSRGPLVGPENLHGVPPYTLPSYFRFNWPRHIGMLCPSRAAVRRVAFRRERCRLAPMAIRACKARRSDMVAVLRGAHGVCKPQTINV